MLTTRADGGHPAIAGESCRRGQRLDWCSYCLHGDWSTHWASVHYWQLMLADLAGGNPRLRCVSNYRPAVAHPAICSVAGHLHQPYPAYGVPLLASADESEESLGSVGAGLCCCHLNDVHHGAAHLPCLACCPQGSGRRQPCDAKIQTSLHYLGLCSPLWWHDVGHQIVEQDLGFRWLNTSSG